MLDQPVNVYLKRHTITNKFYFGKTIKSNLEHYKGSGKRWVRHIKKHGQDKIENVFIHTFSDKEELIEFCEFFSDFYNIVESDKFLNLIPENGLDGGDTKILNYIDMDGNIVKHQRIDDPSALISLGYVPLQSNEGRKRNGIVRTHRNANTVPVLNRITMQSKRITSSEFNPAIHIRSGSKEYYTITGKEAPKRDKTTAVVDLHGNRFVVTKEELLARSDIFSLFSKRGKEIIGDTSAGNRKGMMNCVDLVGKLHNISKENYWEQLKEFGEDRILWPLVHHSCAEGKRRKLLRGKL